MWLGHQYEFYFRSREWRDKGLLPLSGTWWDQPAHWVQALDIIDTIVNQTEREQLNNRDGNRDR